jgi:hypothetical protein
MDDQAGLRVVDDVEPLLRPMPPAVRTRLIQ